MEKIAMHQNMKKTTIKLIETLFNTVYLGTVIISGILLLSLSLGLGDLRWQFGIMALVLGIGDSFHLLPRIYAAWDKGGSGHTALLGAGKLIASLTMTLFYIILWHIGIRHYGFNVAPYITWIVYALGAVRVILCLFPQNRWMHEDQPLKWAIWRNIPFFILGLIVAALFLIGSMIKPDGLSYIWLAVLISFACYLPVVLFSQRNPKVGMLMLPKSVAYALIVLSGFLPA